MKPFVRYAAIGDSLTAGLGAEQPDRDFVAQYAALAERRMGKPVHTYRFGKSGSTTSDLLLRMETDDELKEALAVSELITITAGGNDLLQAAKEYYVSQDQSHLVKALKVYQHNLVKMIRMISRFKQGTEEPFGVRMLTLYNPLWQFEEAVLWVNIFNRQMKRLEKGYVRIVNIYDSFLGKEFDLLSSDFIHPNEEGYRLMAEQTDDVGYAPLD